MYSAEITQHLAEGSKFYATKDFSLAATKYADACEAYNKETGEDSAELLLLYGKALFQNGVAKSGILGGIGKKRRRKKTTTSSLKMVLRKKLKRAKSQSLKPRKATTKKSKKSQTSRQGGRSWTSHGPFLQRRSRNCPLKNQS